MVICCDGIWNRTDQVQDGKVCASNVSKIAGCSALVDSRGIQQWMFYDKGVGSGRLDRLLGGAFGWGIKRKILDAYRFLIINYQPGDELFFFDFSRGAYPVRTTFGLIRNSGLLNPEFGHNLPAPSALYPPPHAPSHPHPFHSNPSPTLSAT